MRKTNNHNRIVALMLSLALILSTQAVVFAEDIPTGVSTTTTETIVTAVPTNITCELAGPANNMNAALTWSAIDNKSAKYAVQLNGNVVATGLTACTYTISGLVNTSSYTIKVGAYTTENSISWNEAEQQHISSFNMPNAQLNSISEPAENDNIITLSWTLSGAENCGKIGIECKGSLIHTIKSPVTEYTFHAEGGVRKYAIRAYSSVYNKVYTVSNSMDSTKIPKYHTSVHKKFDWKATFKKKTTLYSSKKGSKKKGTVKKGVVGIAVGKYPSSLEPWTNPKRVEVELPDGRTGWVSYGSVKIKASIRPSTDYALSSKLEFANNYDSKTDYLVWVNQYTMRVNIFKGEQGNWKLVRTKRVVVGEFNKPLSYGSDYALGNKVGRIYRLHSNGSTYYFDLARGFHGSGYFHTRCKWLSGKYRNSICKTPNTRGCIRMYDADAKYIWNLPRDSRVVIR